MTDVTGTEVPLRCGSVMSQSHVTSPQRHDPGYALAVDALNSTRETRSLTPDIRQPAEAFVQQAIWNGVQAAQADAREYVAAGPATGAPGPARVAAFCSEYFRWTGAGELHSQLSAYVAYSARQAAAQARDTVHAWWRGTPVTADRGVAAFDAMAEGHRAQAMVGSASVPAHRATSGSGATTQLAARPAGQHHDTRPRQLVR